MIVINNGVPKSGTTLILEYQKSLIMMSSSRNGLEEWRMQNGMFFIPTIEDADLATLLKIENDFGDLVIKMHRPPWENNTRRIVEEFNAKVTCCYRDPRDVVLSAIDHGVRTRKGLDKSGAFANIETIDDGIREFKQWVNIYFGWHEYGHALMIKYEDLMADKLSVLKKMADYLGINPGEAVLKKIHDKHQREKETSWNFNKGTSYRWRNEMSESQLATCNELLSEEIMQMGYPIE